jgi:hypothetical protein
MFKRTTQLLAALCLTLVANANAAIPLRPQIDVTGYVIHADLDPASGKLTATAVVTFTALDDLNVAVFGLNNALQVAGITDGTSNLVYERNVTDSTVRVTPTAIVSKGSSATWTFTYAGKPTVETSPVDGIDFATVASIRGDGFLSRFRASSPIASPPRFTSPFPKARPSSAQALPPKPPLLATIWAMAAPSSTSTGRGPAFPEPS